MGHSKIKGTATRAPILLNIQHCNIMSQAKRVQSKKFSVLRGVKYYFLISNLMIFRKKEYSGIFHTLYATGYLIILENGIFLKSYTTIYFEF